jgi:hypothetical protein
MKREDAMKMKCTQEEFRVMVKQKLILLRMTDSNLALSIGRSRNSTNMAINRPGRNPTKWLINRALDLNCF